MLELDISFYVVIDGIRVVNEAKLKELCPKNCSNNGVCSVSGKINFFIFKKTETFV